MDNENNEKIESMITDFLNNGADISYFRFQCDEDKEQFFSMYVEYFTAILKPENEFRYEIDEDKNLSVFYESEEYYFAVSSDYETITCESNDIYFPENDEFKVVLTVLFLTLKELKLMIDEFAAIISRKYNSSGIEKQSNPTGEFKSLGEEYMKRIEKIKKMQTLISKQVDDVKNMVIIKEVQ
tara:strand:- start:3252 stop:3800 length:549 start_codon:yes stop_codon:yes gene_type:complete